MKKLSLKLDDLRVDTFQTSTGLEARGTVVGEQRTVVGNTCGYSCPNTCGIIPDTQNCREGVANTHDCPVCA